MLAEQEDNVENKGDYNNNSVQDFKLVVEELQAISKELKAQFYQEQGQNGKAQVMQHLGEGESNADHEFMKAPLERHGKNMGVADKLTGSRVEKVPFFTTRNPNL